MDDSPSCYKLELKINRSLALIFKKGVIHLKQVKCYGAIDVDDSHFNVALIKSSNEELLHFKCTSNVGSIIKNKQQKIFF